MTRGRATRTACTLGLVVAVLLGACGGDDGDEAPATEEATAVPAECVGPPITMVVQGDGVGGPAVEVADGVARRVAVLPEKVTFAAEERSGLESEAAVTPLGQYTIYLAEGSIDRTQLETNAEVVAPEATGAIATLTVTPPTEGGLLAGDVVSAALPEYPTISGLATISLEVRDGATVGAPIPSEGREAQGTVEVLAVDDEQLCVEIDVQVTEGDVEVASLEGTVLVPVVRAANTIWRY